MENIIVNINNNRGNSYSVLKEQLRTLSVSKLNYYYDIKTKYGEGGGDGGSNLEDLCNKLKSSMDFFKVKERKLKIELTSNLEENSEFYGVLEIEKLYSIKSNLSKEFDNIIIKY